MPVVEQPDMLPSYGRAIAAALVALVAAIVIIGLQKKADFRITVRRGKVSYRGRFPADRMGVISDFLLHDLAPSAPIHVIGNWTRGRVLRVSVKGKIGDGDAQRIRNFLKMALRG
jgi:hypothetical protein